MLAVARSVAVRETATPRGGGTGYGPQPGRLSIVAECLHYNDKLRLVQFLGRSPYGFNEASATPGTLRLVRSNQA